MTTKGAKIAHKHSTSSDTTEVRHGQLDNMNSQVNEISAVEVTHQFVNEQIKASTEQILRKAESVCALLTGCSDLNTAGNRGFTA